MTKAEVRKEFLAKRKGLTFHDVQLRSKLITSHFIDFLATTNMTNESVMLHTFLPIQRHNEVDTWMILRTLWEQFPQIQLVVSVTDTTANQLTHYPLLPSTTLKENRWGIPEPLQAGQIPIESAQIDIVLVPLLAFDKQGHRVGYGGGYYDRFLANCRPDCFKAGLSLFESINEITNVELTDVPLNVCITPEQVHFFN